MRVNQRYWVLKLVCEATYKRKSDNASAIMEAQEQEEILVEGNGADNSI